MSSLNGIAQFTNRFAQNIMGYEEGKKKEAERLADKERELARQQQQDQNAQQTHDVTLQSSKIKLNQEKVADDEFSDTNTFNNTRNQIKYLQSIGADEQDSVDVLSKAVNSNKKLPYTVEFERDQAGKIIQRKDQNGKPFYFQTIIDKETGEELGRKSTTFEEAQNSYTQLQRGGAIEDEIAATKAAREAKALEIKDKLTLRAGEINQDIAKHGATKGIDHNYAMTKLGVENEFDLEKLAIQHGYRLEQLDRTAVNNIALETARSDVYSGGTPIVGGGGNGPAWGSFDALIGPESNGQQLDSNGRPLTSSAGAIGIAQVMPATGEYVAKKHGIKWDANRYKTDPNYNYNLGKLYYQEQLNKYGHPALAYAAYNAGPGAVDSWIEKNPAMRNPDAMGMQNFIKAIPFSETKNYVAKIHRQSSGGGVQVQRSVPAIPKAAKGSSKQSDSGKGIASVTDYNANIDKGVNTALKGVKQLGIKPDVATTATFARAGTKLKEMGRAKSNQEFLNLYQEAFDLVLDSVPERDRKKMNKSDQNALGHKVLLSMVGASSLTNLKEIVYKINPSAKGDGQSVTAGGLTLNLPGQQQARAPAKQTAQTSKLGALYARGLPAPKIDPKAQENLEYMGNLNDNMDW